MQLKISTTSMIPIYEQIADQIRTQITQGILRAGDGLPSVRAFARDYKISALTVKKAYDLLESEGLVLTVHGKGTCVAEISSNLVQEELQKQTEALFDKAIKKARQMDLSDEDILDLVRQLLEADNDSTE